MGAQMEAETDAGMDGEMTSSVLSVHRGLLGS